MRRLSFHPGLTIRGREWRGLRGLSGKPAHPPLTDIPIAAFVLAAAADVVSLLATGAAWAGDLYRAATILLLAGVAVSLLAFLTGFLDWRTTEKGSKVREAANTHAWAMILVAGLVAANLVLRYLAGWELTGTPFHVMVVSVFAAVLTAAGAALGGSLVYDFGFNVEGREDAGLTEKESEVVPADETPGGTQFGVLAGGSTSSEKRSEQSSPDAPEPVAMEVESARLLANANREELYPLQLSDEDIDRLANEFIAENPRTDSTEFSEWVAEKVAREGA
jgi:uncharacterized membrane protein